MTTTTLTSRESTFAVGRQHVQFDVRSSTPTSGAMTDVDAGAHWFVFRPATSTTVPIHAVSGCLDFAWCGIDGDVVFARAYDSSGNEGSDVSYTYSVAADTDADIVRYVDNTAGTGSGTSGDPYATIAEAKADMSSLTTGQVGVVFVREGQTHTMGATTAYSSDSGPNTDCLVRFVRWGSASTQPILQWSDDSDGFAAGLKGGIHIEDLELDGGYSSGSNFAVTIRRESGTLGDREPFNVMIFGCLIENWWGGIETTETVLGNTNRAEACLSFVAIVYTTIQGCASYHVYGLNYYNEFYVRNLTLGDKPSGANTQQWRSFDLGRHYIEGLVQDCNIQGALRITGEAATDTNDGTRLGTWINCRHVGTDEYVSNFALEADAGDNGLAYVTDVRFVNCQSDYGNFQLSVDFGGGANMVNATRLQYVNCIAGRPFLMAAAATAVGTVTSVQFRDCSVIRSYQDGNFIQLTNAAARYATGCFSLKGCTILWVPSGSDGCQFIGAGSMTLADAAAKFSDCDYNHAGKTDATTVFWIIHSDSPFQNTLANWQTASSEDSNSSLTQSTDFNYTDDGVPTASTRDLRLASASGELSGTGFPRTIAVDADGYLRDASTPDAGPYEYGASTEPTVPTLSSGNLTPAGMTASATMTVTLSGEGSITPAGMSVDATMTTLLTGEGRLQPSEMSIEATMTSNLTQEGTVYGAVAYTISLTMTASLGDATPPASSSASTGSAGGGVDGGHLVATDKVRRMMSRFNPPTRRQRSSGSSIDDLARKAGVRLPKSTAPRSFTPKLIKRFKPK